MDKDQKPAKPPIEKPWCLYGVFYPWGFGKITDESPDGKTVHILYSANQAFPAELWYAKYVRRFFTLQEAVEAYYRSAPDYPLAHYERRAEESFPDGLKSTSPV